MTEHQPDERSDEAREIDETMDDAQPEKLDDESLEERARRDEEKREPGLDAV